MYTSRATQKEKLAIIKETAGSIVVISFQNGKRYSTFSGLDLIRAFIEVQNHTMNGRLVVITDDDGSRAITSYEFKNGCRVPYDVAKEHSKQLVKG
jgi:hypothetical protein